MLRRLAYLGDAMSHATVGGVAVAYLGGWSITVSAIGAGLAMAALMSLLAGHPRLREDAIIGSVEAALFAAGVVIISHNHDIGIDLTHVLSARSPPSTRVTCASTRSSAAPVSRGARTAPYVHTNQLTASHGPFQTPIDGAAILRAACVSAAFAIPPLIAAFAIFGRRDLTS